MKFLAALNQTYIATHCLVEKGDVYQFKFLKAVEELKKGQELKKRLEEEAKATKEDKASMESELTKAKVENTKLQTQLQGTQDDY